MKGNSILYAQRSRKKKKKKSSQCPGDEEAEEFECAEEPVKPIPPPVVDRMQVELQVREKSAVIRKKPGESALIPELSLAGNVTPNEICPRWVCTVAR